MPATTRHRMPAAALIGCLTAMAAPVAIALTIPVPVLAAPPPAIAEPANAGFVASANAAIATPATAVFATPATPAPAHAGFVAAGAAATAAPGGATVPTPGGSAPSGGTGTRPGRAMPTVNPNPPSVTVTVGTAGSGAPAYRIQVRNPGRTPVDTMVRQTLPPGAAATSISGGGRATRSVGPATPSEVTWLVTVPAAGTTTLRTALAPPPVQQALVTPACVYARNGTTPYDCATATWQAAPVSSGKDAGRHSDKAGASPLWRRPPVLAGGLVALLTLGVGMPLWWQRRRRRGAYPDPADMPQADPAAVERASRGTVYPRAAVPRPVSRRRRPPVWLVVGTASMLLVGVVGTAAWTATTQVSGANAGKQPTSGAWVGQADVGAVGSTLQDASFEFTVYRVACLSIGVIRQCQAIVGVHNGTPEKQPWHGALQRAYLPGGTWVSTDENATRAANGGRDVFANPVPAGGRLLLPLVFTVDGRNPPTQLELRSGVFSAGVRVNVP